MKKIINFAALLLLIAIVGACGNKENNNSSEKGEEISQEITEASGVVLDNVTENDKFKVVDNVLYSENLPIVVDFYATWCGPCKNYSPIFHEVAEKYKDDAIFLSIDVDKFPEIANAYKVEAVPTTAFIMTGGGTMGTETGELPAATLEMYINQLIANNAGANMEL